MKRNASTAWLARGLVAVAVVGPPGAFAGRGKDTPQCRVGAFNLEKKVGSTPVAMATLSDGKPCAIGVGFSGRALDTMTVVASPAHGSVELADKFIRYRAEPGFAGTDHFSVRAFGRKFRGAATRNATLAVNATVPAP